MDLLVEAELRKATRRPGCSLCRVGEEAALRYLRSVLHEGVNDGATRTRLDRSGGFCRRHAWHFLGLEWESMHDSLSTATLSEGLVEAAEEILDGFLDAPPRSQRRRAARAPLEGVARSLAPAEPCPACQAQADHESYAAAVLLRSLEDGGWRQRFQESDGLCLFHFRRAIIGETSADRARWLALDQRRRLRQVRSDLQEYGRKHDYRFSQEAYGREADAAARATGLLAGTWFDVPRGPGADVKAERGVARGQEEEGNRG